MSKLLGLALVGLLAAAAFAMPGKCGDSQRGMCAGFESGMLMEKGKEKLGLNGDQIGKIKGLWKEHQAKMIKIRAEVDMAELDLRNAMDTDELNKGKIDPLIDKLSSIKAKMQKERMGHMVDVSNILTKEQRVKARELMRDCMHGKKGGKKGCSMGEKSMSGDGMDRGCPHSK